MNSKLSFFFSKKKKKKKRVIRQCKCLSTCIYVHMTTHFSSIVCAKLQANICSPVWPCMHAPFTSLLFPNPARVCTCIRTRACPPHLLNYFKNTYSKYFPYTSVNLLLCRTCMSQSPPLSIASHLLFGVN